MSVLLVASEGGHLVELQVLAQRLGVGERAWVTFDSPQSRSALADEEVHFAPFAGTRDLVGTARAAWWARDLLRGHYFDTIISTGASIALSVLPLAARMGADCYYFESATRTSGPSLTGRLLEPFHSVNLFAQYESWANRRWKYHASIFDMFSPVPAQATASLKRVVVSLGLHKGFDFRRAVERLIQIIPEGTEVLWQTGGTDTSGLDIKSHVSLPAQELARVIAECDVVITHAGIGSIISALQAGKRPLVIPRRARFKEHVDDHQALIAGELARRDLVVQAEADEVQWADAVMAASSRVEAGRMPIADLARLNLRTRRRS
jgi:UDP-N-acetylglucosamine--N-acetylmuramyl-(pentapeptide) pyrophosphoryl-undecaprenol N-acetylglucosamine transferase